MARNRKAEEQGLEADRLLEEAAKAADEQDENNEPEATIEETVLDNHGSDAQATEPTAAQTGAETDDRYKSLEQRLASLQGMYNAEVPRLNQQIKYYQDLLADTVAAQQSAQTKAQEPQVNVGAVKEFATEYPDVYEAVASMIANMKAEILGAVSNVVGPVMTKVDETSNTLTKTNKQTFETQLKNRVPDIEVINNSPDFIKWLQEFVPYTTNTRHQLLLHAFNSQDVETTAKFFTDFKEEAGIAEKVRPNREQQLGMPRSQGQQHSSNTNKTKQITSSMIAVFYNDCRKGLYRGRDAERSQIEAAINDAISKGTVVKNT